MAKGKEMGKVKTPTGSTYYYYWDEKSGDVHVGNEFAGKSSSASDAHLKADHYATTLQIRKD